MKLQRKAFHSVERENFSRATRNENTQLKKVLNGSPGTGKTHQRTFISRKIDDLNEQLRLIALNHSYLDCTECSASLLLPLKNVHLHC